MPLLHESYEDGNKYTQRICSRLSLPGAVPGLTLVSGAGKPDIHHHVGVIWGDIRSLLWVMQGAGFAVGETEPVTVRMAQAGASFHN